VNLLLLKNRNGRLMLFRNFISFAVFLFLVCQVSLVVRVGRKRAIYIPRSVAEELGIGEGDKMVLEVVDGKIVLTPVKLGGRREFWGEVSVKEVEEVGEEITKGITGGR